MKKLIVLSFIVLFVIVPGLGPIGWEEIDELRELQGGPRAPWHYAQRVIPFGNGGEDVVVEVGCGGGSNRYCSMTVRLQKDLLLHFGGNCDTIGSDPRVWIKQVPGKKPQFMTYHYILINDSVGANLPGGYWVWSWDGEQYQPKRRALQPLVTAHGATMSVLYLLSLLSP